MVVKYTVLPPEILSIRFFIRGKTIIYINIKRKEISKRRHSSPVPTKR